MVKGGVAKSSLGHRNVAADCRRWISENRPMVTAMSSTVPPSSGISTTGKGPGASVIGAAVLHLHDGFGLDGGTQPSGLQGTRPPERLTPRLFFFRIEFFLSTGVWWPGFERAGLVESPDSGLAQFSQ